MISRALIFALVGTIGLAAAASVRADDNVRDVQSKLSDQGFYFGQIDGAYSSDLSAALSRYQIRNGLPITGQLDAETSKTLGAKSAIRPSTAGSEQGSETWRRLRKGEPRTSAKAPETCSPRTNEANTGPSPQSPEFSSERLRDYVAAFVLAGLDKSVGAETEFFADRVEYYDSGTMDREKIREDLKRYDERWPERHFWVAGAIDIEPQSENRVRVSFPLGFKLRNGSKQSSGKVDKALVLESAGDDLQIVAVNERKAD